MSSGVTPPAALHADRRPAALHRRARWALAFRLARREARRHPWRHALVVALVFVPVLATFSAFSGIDTVMDAERRRAETAFAGAAAVVDVRFGGQPATGSSAPTLPSPDPGVHVERSWQGVDWLVVEPSDAAAPVAPVETMSVAADGRLASRFQVDDGRLPSAAGEVLLTPAAAAVGGWSVGDAVHLATTDDAFTVVGVGIDRHAVDDRRVVLSADQPEAFWTRTVDGDLPPVVVNGNYVGPNEQIERAVVWVPSGVDPSSVEPVRSSGAAYTVLGPDLSSEPGVAIGVTVAGAGVAMVAAVVASAAFAIGARRQLRQVGLLATAGADPAVVRAALVWQGVLPGALAAALALATGSAAAAVLNARGVPERVTDVAGTSVQLSAAGAVVATLLGVGAGVAAAWQPARSTSRLPLLSLLGGRRPLPPIRTRIPLAGLAAVALGCVLLAIAPDATADGHELSALVPIVGVISFALGAVGLAPALVAALGPVARRATGLVRLALRGLVRHRGQSAATVAAVAVALALPVGLLTAYPRPDHETDRLVQPDGTTHRLVEVIGEEALVVALGGLESTYTPDAVEAEQVRAAYRAREADVLGALDGAPRRVATVEAPVPDRSDTSRDLGATLRVAVVADDDLDEVLQPWAARELARGRALATGFYASGPIVVGTASQQVEVPLGSAPSGGVPITSVVEADVLVSASTAARLPGTHPLDAVTFVRADGASAAERRRLDAFAHPERRADPTLAEVRTARASPPDAGELRDSVYVNVREERGASVDPWALAMLAMAAIATLLALVVLTVTLTLRSVDGADDLRAAVAAGAPPVSMRRVRAIEGTVLAALGAALALPLGWLPVTSLRMGAADRGWVPGLGGPGWLVLPVLLAPVVLAGMLWTVVPWLRAAATSRRTVDQLLPRW